MNVCVLADCNVVMQSTAAAAVHVERGSTDTLLHFDVICTSFSELNDDNDEDSNFRTLLWLLQTTLLQIR